MKAQCERCKEIVPLLFRTESAAIRVTCPACRQSYIVQAEATTAATSEPAAAAPRTGPPAPLPALPSTDAETAALFVACEAVWDDALRHDAFLRRCQQVAAFPYAAGCYRRAAADPSRQAVAEARLLEIRQLVMQTLIATPRPEPHRRRQRLLSFVLIAALVVLVASLAFRCH